MKLLKYLPVLTVLLCVPGIFLRTLHLLYGFTPGTDLPESGNLWFWSCVTLFILGGILFAAVSAPLRALSDTPFEQLLGSSAPLFRMVLVSCGLLISAGGLYYLYLTVTVVDPDLAGWAQVMETVYSLITILAGVVCITLARVQGAQMNSITAKLTLLPTFWSCLHLLVAYRIVCVDPKIPSYAFDLIGGLLILYACYHFAKLLFDKPRPRWLAISQATAVLVCLSNVAGCGLAVLLGSPPPYWTLKGMVRDCITGVVCVVLLTELSVLARNASAALE